MTYERARALIHRFDDERSADAARALTEHERRVSIIAGPLCTCYVDHAGGPWAAAGRGAAATFLGPRAL